MSAATQGAVSGAATGAAAGSVVGPWGTVVGGVLGGASGYLSGMGGDKRAAAEAAARKRLQQALSRYGGRTATLANATTDEAWGIDRSWQNALSAHLQQPDLGAALPGRVATEQADFDAAAQPALAPMAGRTGAQNAYLRGVQANTQRRVSDATAPMAFEAGAERSSMADQEYRNRLATTLQQLGLQSGRLGTLQQLQQSTNYIPFARAQGQYGTDRARAETAGSKEALAGGALQAGGGLLASAFMNRGT